MGGKDGEKPVVNIIRLRGMGGKEFRTDRQKFLGRSQKKPGEGVSKWYYLEPPAAKRGGSGKLFGE